MDKEQMQKDFVRHVKWVANYWSKQPDMTDEEKCDGVAFSIICMLDGVSGGMPPFAVRAIDRNETEGEDIAGSLHELYSKAGE